MHTQAGTHTHTHTKHEVEMNLLYTYSAETRGVSLMKSCMNKTAKSDESR